MKMKKKQKAGFTLMEVAIAVAVVVVGVMSLFALISGGLNSSAKAIADTHAAMFANDVFSGLRAKSLDISEEGVAGAWEQFWDDFQNSVTNISVAAPDAWYGQTFTTLVRPIRTINIPLSVFGDPEGSPNIHPIVYRNVPFHDSNRTNIVNISLRYRCEVDSLYPLAAGAGQVLWTNRTMVTLKVWEGEFGSADEADALVYYTEFDNPGDL